MLVPAGSPAGWRWSGRRDLLNPYHFARQFKAATGLPPHQYVILRRVERAK
jgi:AraC-like DNA-binding protein